MSDANKSGDEGIDPRTIFRGWWRQRGRIFLLAAAGAVGAAAVMLAALVLRPAHQEISQTFRLLFPGAAKGLYPRGGPFVPSDLVATPVLQEVFRRNDLNKYLQFDEFKSALAVVDENPALDRLRREYQDRLSGRILPPAEREKIETAFQTKARELQAGEFTLTAHLGGRLKSWPPTLSGKVLDDVLLVWAKQSRDRGVFQFDVSPFSNNILPRPPYGEDYPILLDRLRISLGRISANLQQLASVPGARLIRAGDRQVSLGELQLALEDDLRYRLGMIQAQVDSMGLFRSPLLTSVYVREQLFRLQLRRDEAQNRADAIRNALVRYAESRPGSGRTGAGGASAATAGGGPATQISDSFLDRILELSYQGADTSFRQDLADDLVDTGRGLAAIESERQIYDRMLRELSQPESAHAGLAVADRSQWQRWVDDQIAAMMTRLNRNLVNLSALNQEIAQQRLQPSLIYAQIEPLRQARVPAVSMRSIILATGFVYILYLGGCLTGLAWRNLGQRPPRASPAEP